jgi:hypothetical protein
MTIIYHLSNHIFLENQMFLDYTNNQARELQAPH